MALVDPFYIPTALAGACPAFVLNLHHRAWNRVFDVLDAAAPGLWAAAGAQMVLSAGPGSGPAILGGNALYTSIPHGELRRQRPHRREH